MFLTVMGQANSALHNSSARTVIVAGTVMIPTLPASTRTRTLTNPVAKFQYPIASHAVNTLFPDLVINREFYFSCILGDGTNQETCEGSGCCWWPLEAGSDEPWCYQAVYTSSTENVLPGDLSGAAPKTEECVALSNSDCSTLRAAFV